MVQCGLRRRHLLLLGALAPGFARAAALPVELTRAAAVTPAAAFGLFNNVAQAGNRLVAVGERGRILLSDDAGHSWRPVPVPVSATLVAARFATLQLGWVVGQMGVILKTRDGGESWRLVMDGVRAADLMVREAQAARQDGLLQSAQLLVSLGATNPMLSIVVLSPTHVLAFGAFGLALETVDAGETWAGFGARVQNPQGLHVYGALQAGDAIVAAGEAGLLLHGAPAGMLAAVTSAYQGSLFGLVSPAANNILAFGLQGTLLHSADFGSSWRSLAPVCVNAVLCGAVLNDGRIVLGDASGNVLISRDAGASFMTVPGTLPVTALAQAPDGALILASPAGLRRVSSGMSG